jgi:hypothetical protein
MARYHFCVKEHELFNNPVSLKFCLFQTQTNYEPFLPVVGNAPQVDYLSLYRKLQGFWTGSSLYQQVVIREGLERQVSVLTKALIRSELSREALRIRWIQKTNRWYSRHTAALGPLNQDPGLQESLYTLQELHRCLKREKAQDLLQAHINLERITSLEQTIADLRSRCQRLRLDNATLRKQRVQVDVSSLGT